MGYGDAPPTSSAEPGNGRSSARVTKPRRGKRSGSGLSRFIIFFCIQAAVLLIVVTLCYRGLGRVRHRLEELGGSLQKATVAAEVLHYSDVLRVIHVTLIGAGSNAEYVDVRLKRLAEVEDLLEKSIAAMEDVSWSDEERGVVEKVASGMRGYSKAFAPILERSRKATPQQLPDLIQANTELRRDAYNLLLEMLPQLRHRSDSIVQVNAVDFGRLQLSILIGLAVSILLAAWIFRTFSVHTRLTRRQAEELNRSMKALADGDLDASAQVISTDELGRVAENLNEMFRLLARNIRTITEISTKLESVADVVGSRSRTVISSTEGQGQAVDQAYYSIDNLKNGIRKISLNVDALSASSEETSSSATELAALMEEVGRQTDTLFSSVEQTASATHQMVESISDVNQNVDFLKSFVTDTSASMVEMSSSIGTVERSAVRSLEIAQTAREAAQSGMEAVRETIKGMDDIRRSVHDANEVVSSLGQRSAEIGRILKVINDVASQTNLLALNAAILAAQAGKYGGGFSVVAEEIRDLSERTASSTKEIGALIHSVQSEVARTLESIGRGARSVDHGVTLAGQAGRVLEKILESAQNSLDMGQSIANAMREQARSSENIAAAVARVQDMVKHVNAATNQQATGSDHILRAVEQMRDVATSVRAATAEQKMGSKMISSAAEQMIDMIRQISGVATDQAGESERIVKTMEQVRHIADGNKRSANEMNESITLIADAVRELDDEVRKFKTHNEQPTYPGYGNLEDRTHSTLSSRVGLHQTN